MYAQTNSSFLDFNNLPHILRNLRIHIIQESKTSAIDGALSMPQSRICNNLQKLPYNSTHGIAFLIVIIAMSRNARTRPLILQKLFKKMQEFRNIPILQQIFSHTKAIMQRLTSLHDLQRS